MKRMKKLVRSRSGFTLIEMIATLALLAILTTMAASVMMPMTKATFKANRLAEVERVYDTLSGELVADMERAAGPMTFNDGSLAIPVSGGSVTYSARDGVIYKSVNGGEAGPMLEKGYYRGWSAAFAVSESDGVYTLSLTLSGEDGEALPSHEYKVRPLTLNQYGG